MFEEMSQTNAPVTGIERAERAFQLDRERSIEQVVAGIGGFLGDDLELLAALVGNDVEVVNAALTTEGSRLDVFDLRLRTGLQLLEIVQDQAAAHVCRAWLVGCNPHLDERAPVDVVAILTYAPDSQLAAARLQAAAIAFVDGCVD